MLSSCHPQTDGSSEIMNGMTESYLRCYSAQKEENWSELLRPVEFAYNSVVCEETGMSPFETDLSWSPKTVIDLSSKHQSSLQLQNSQNFEVHLKESMKDAIYATKVATARQAADSLTRYKLAQYKIGDKVWIRKILYIDAYSKSQPSAMLGAKQVGAFKTSNLVGKNAVKLELPSHFIIHPVIHVLHTLPSVSYPAEVARAIPQRLQLPQLLKPRSM